jgi:hypothetical protein
LNTHYAQIDGYTKKELSSLDIAQSACRQKGFGESSSAEFLDAKDGAAS